MAMTQGVRLRSRGSHGATLSREPEQRLETVETAAENLQNLALLNLIDRIHSDVYYLENWSPFMDWMIIFKTAWQMIAPPKTAY